MHPRPIFPICLYDVANADELEPVCRLVEGHYQRSPSEEAEAGADGLPKEDWLVGLAGGAICDEAFTHDASIPTGPLHHGRLRRQLLRPRVAVRHRGERDRYHQWHVFRSLHQ